MFRGSYKLHFEYITNKTTNFFKYWHEYIKISLSGQREYQQDTAVSSFKHTQY